jgi:hypothetical protein
MSCIQELCKIFNWTIITNGTLETPAHKYSILLIWNSLYSKKIAIKLGPVNIIDIYVKKYNNNLDTNGSASTNTATNGHAIDQNSNGNSNHAGFGNTSDLNDDDNSEDCINLDWLAAIQKNYLKIDIYNAYPGRTLMNKFELFLADMAFS